VYCVEPVHSAVSIQIHGVFAAVFVPCNQRALKKFIHDLHQSSMPGWPAAQHSLPYTCISRTRSDRVRSGECLRRTRPRATKIGHRAHYDVEHLVKLTRDHHGAPATLT
jgi:hypothetical protein